MVMFYRHDGQMCHVLCDVYPICARVWLNIGRVRTPTKLLLSSSNQGIRKKPMWNKMDHTADLDCLYYPLVN